MRIKKLREISKISPGINQTRIDETDELYFYDKDSFEWDFLNIKSKYNDIENNEEEIYKVREGDIIINNNSQIATIVSKENDKKYFSVNYTKINLNHRVIDKGYFLYLFNKNQDIKKQISKNIQGSNQIQKITLNILRELDIPLIAYDKQQTIGKTYLLLLKLKNNLNNYIESVEKITETVIEKQLKEKENDK